MRCVCWAVVCCLVIVSTAKAGDGEQLVLNQLPPDVVNHIREVFRAEPMHGRREFEDGKTRYIVTATHMGHAIEIFASPDGGSLIRKSEDFSLAGWMSRLPGLAFFVLLPGVIVGAVTRWIVRAARGRSLSVPAGWLSSAVGTWVVMACAGFNLATVPREKDVLVLVGYCVVLASIAASIVEVIVLTSGTGSSQGNHAVRWVLGCCVIAAVSLALTIPLEILTIERENRSYEKLVLRPTANSPELPKL